MNRRALACLALLLFGCTEVSPDELADGGFRWSGGQGRLTGTVWAPGNAPGLVLPGQEIPVHEAVVYLYSGRPEPIPQQVYCDECRPPNAEFVQSDHKGRFELDGVRAGNYRLVIEKAQFRLERPVTVTPGEFALELGPELTTLPSIHRPEKGDWTPRIALASGDYDSLEDVLGKMGMGALDEESRFVLGSASAHFDVYSNGGALDDEAIGPLGELVADSARLSQYHVVIISCSGDDNTDALQEPVVLRNLRKFVADGGKLYITDYSGEWADNVFPAQVELGQYDDTPAGAYDPVTGTWDMTQFGNADRSSDYDSDARTMDKDLGLWLDGQIGPMVDGSTGFFVASNFEVADSWNIIEAVHAVEVGTDAAGGAVVDEPRIWVAGSTPEGDRPLTVTYEPTGCGRVMYSSYHTTEEARAGLNPQERVLLYLLLAIGECKAGPVAVE